ncbi:MAG: hypothetical protein IJP79_08845 [Paludibacteraceae bacterium]|nr:hypothetical protein [Paludibacteraceae bacterium]MBQ7748054.1 hypothetical protein [Paludibacteraceae bacterium]
MNIMSAKGLFVLAIASAALSLTSCAKSSTPASSSSASNEASSALSVDDIVDNGSKYIDKEITLEGVCTHVCRRSHRKLFLIGSDDTKSIRVQAGGDIETFEDKAAKKVVEVTGILKVQQPKIEDAAEEFEADDNSGKKDVTAGCDADKKAIRYYVVATSYRIIE